MKFLSSLFIFLCVSCQMSGGIKLSSQSRKLASLFRNNSQQHFYEYDWKIGVTPIWIVNGQINKINKVVSIDILSTTVDCSGKNIVKVHGENKVRFYLTEKSKIQCLSNDPKIDKVKVRYNYYGNSIVDLNERQLKLIERIIKGVDANQIDLVISDLKELGLYNIFKKKITLTEFNKIPFEKGDYIKLEINPQVKMINCPDKKCNFLADIFGLLNFENMNLFKGSNLLKFEQLPPYLFFCGSRFAAGNIHFRADVAMEFAHVIDENGFSCDVNSFILSDQKLEYEFQIAQISKEKILSILLGKPEEFLEQKDLAIKNEIKASLDYLKSLNELYQSEVRPIDFPDQHNGYIELWWEPFGDCKNDTQVNSEEKCLEKEMVMTRSRVVNLSSKLITVSELNIASLGLKQVVKSVNPLVAFVVKLCPQDLDNFVFDQTFHRDKVVTEETFKQRILSYQKSSCRISDHGKNSKKFNYRWLLASVPKEVEKEEIDMLVEDYQLIQSPDEKVLKDDPLQKGTIFFDLYLKNLRRREILFKRSRILEITK